MVLLIWNRRWRLAKKLKSIKSLQNKCEALWKLVCHRRDGQYCQVKLHYPELEINHSSTFQVDHCFSRSDKNLFIIPSNGTVVCSSCNMLKSMQSKSVHRLIDQIVIKREGIEVFEAMKSINMSKRPNVLWHNREWLENKINELETRLAKFSMKPIISIDL